MNRSLFYSVLLIFTFTTISFISIAQELEQEFINPKSFDYLKTYLGKINEKDLYLVQNDYHNNSTVLSFVKDKNLSTTTFVGELQFRNKTITKGNPNNYFDIKFKEWFINNNTLYSISEKKTVHEAWIQLNKYDQNLILIDSTIIYNDSISDYKNFSFSFKCINNEIGIIETSQSLDNQYFLIVLSLNDYHKTINQFKLPEKEKFICSDFTFNDKHEVFAIFEGEENLNNRPKKIIEQINPLKKAIGDQINPLKLKSIILCSSSNKVNISELKSNYENQFVRSYKFEKINNETVILGALTFSSIGGMHMNGYQIRTMNYGDSIIKTDQFFKTSDLNSPSLWSTSDYTKLIENKYIQFSHFQFLKEIKLHENGSYIFISEGNYQTAQTTGSGGGFTYSPGTTNGGGGSVVSHDASNLSTSNFNYAGDIIVSLISLKDNSLIWSTKTKNRIDINASKAHNNMENGSYFLIINENQMQFYYTECQKNFDEFGNIIEKYKEYFGSTDNTVAKFEVFLSNGVSKIIKYSPNLTDRDSEILIPQCSHLNNQNEILFFTNRMVGVKNYCRVQLRPK